MGVDISDLLTRHQTTLKEQKGIKVSIDAFNIIYQFLSSIRQPDGTPLTDTQGRVTSHLSGVFYRTINLLDAGIKPVYVFDGKPSSLKNRTLEARRLVKEKAKIELEVAREAGDEERVRSLSSRINYLSRDMVNEAMELLDYMGVPYVVAPSEGEAQASVMCKNGLVDGVISQDYDCILFGARRVFRNFTMFGRRKVPGRNIYLNVNPEYIDLEENLNLLGINRDQLIEIGIMVGTDFNRGIQRVGAKTAMKLIKKHGNIGNVLASKNMEIENLDEVIELFRNPPYMAEISTDLKRPDTDKIIDFLCNRHDFSPNRVEPYIQTLNLSVQKNFQKNLDSFF